jgi:hypothetical protein
MVQKAEQAGLEIDPDQRRTYMPQPDVTPAIDDLIRFPFGLAGRALRPVLHPRWAKQTIHPSVDVRAGYEAENLRLARAGTPLERPVGRRLWYTIPPLLDYYLGQYDDALKAD